MTFNYHEAFSRNIGWITPTEQNELRGKRVAVAGCGGVSGRHLELLARLGVGQLNISDFDTFEIANFNRQMSATLPNVTRPKVDVIEEMILTINPEIEIKKFPDGINTDNVDKFLSGADLYVDGLDYFAVDIRRLVFERCHRQNIPAVTAAPLGMGAAVLSFLPRRTSFEEYFRLDGHRELDQLIRFLVGLSPWMPHRGYLAWPQAVDFANKKGPSTGMACAICAGMAITEALKILLGRGRVIHAPSAMHFDAYRSKFVRTWRPGGNNNPIQKATIALVKRQLAMIDKAR
ncbi:MAG: molybdopterin/thiamine biosynthesis adenylyltransferase [Gammaproteobacteria bacterium]|jgi:molybdopterin/thiamine biosynthesis adenylyltransferase